MVHALAHDAFPAQEFDFMLAQPTLTARAGKKDLEGRAARTPHARPALQGDGTTARSCRSYPVERRPAALPCQYGVEMTQLGARQPHAEVHNGQLLSHGDAGQGESNIGALGLHRE